MTDRSPDPYRKPALILAGVAVSALSGAIVFAFLLPPEEFNYQTPAARAINALGIIGLLSIMGIGIVALAAISKRVETSESVAKTVVAIRRGASALSRSKVTTSSGMSTADELAKWVVLRDTGVVTEDEFETARSELLKTQR